MVHGHDTPNDSLKHNNFIKNPKIEFILINVLRLISNFTYHLQMDVRGNAYGLLATHPAAPLVTLHHLDHLEPLLPNHTQDESLNTLIQAYQLDPARTLQQSVCYYKNWGGIWSISISWGYTIQIYNSFLLPPDLQTPFQTFKTWRSWANGPFTFNTRPISPDPCEQPIIYFLDWAHEASKRESLTSYKKFGAESPKECKGKVDYRRTVEKILVSAPKMDSQEFAKVPFLFCISRTHWYIYSVCFCSSQYYEIG